MSRAHQLTNRLQLINESLIMERRIFTSPFKAEKGTKSWCVKDNDGEIVKDGMTEDTAKELAKSKTKATDKIDKLKDTGKELKSNLQSVSSGEGIGHAIGKAAAQSVGTTLS